MLEGATMAPKHFLTVYLSEPPGFRIVPVGTVKSVSRAYVKEKL